MPNNPDTLVPDSKVMAELSISTMTLWRWSRDATLQFPAKIQIRNRNYRSRAELERFKHRMGIVAEPIRSERVRLQQRAG